ncbi:hypothetical protein Tco_0519101 [Tanacetum coccineum]
MATCHHLSGATWPVSSHRTTSQRRSMMAFNGGQRWSTVANHRRPSLDHRQTTTGPPPDNRWTTGQRSHVSPRGSATSADWVLHAYVAATSAADVAEGIITLLQDSNTGHPAKGSKRDV